MPSEQKHLTQHRRCRCRQGSWHPTATCVQLTKRSKTKPSTAKPCSPVKQSDKVNIKELTIRNMGIIRWKLWSLFATLLLQSNGFSIQTSTTRIQRRPFSLRETFETDSDSKPVVETSKVSTMNTNGSKRQMLKFAIPALGIFLSNPLLSNIDNAFVGKTVGTSGLAALSPATICTDQMLYLFSFLSRATTGIVSRAYSSKKTEEDNIAASRDAASTPLTFALISGVCLSIFYALFTPKLLALLNVDPILRPASASYIYWRGSIAWAALIQSVCLSVMLATRDAITPLKIISLAAVVNIIGDTMLCVFPFQMGCSGAAAATSFATLFSSAKMLQHLARKKLLPKLSIPKFADLKELLVYVGPLFIITITRLLGFVSMQKRAMAFGTQPLAAYQIGTNAMILFLLFGEPLSQLHQTKLPALLDAKDRKSVTSTMKSVLTLAGYTSLGIGALTFLTLTLGSGLFTSDVAVQGIVKNIAPVISLAVMQTIIGTALDGAMLAARDFSYIITVGVATCGLQLSLLGKCNSLSAIYLTFFGRLAAYSIATLLRIGSGRGPLGKIVAKATEENPSTDKL